ncbi:MAG TPA: sigma 54-interacting transcriptional regulator [Polyangiaceae bacterium]
MSGPAELTLDAGDLSRVAPEAQRVESALTLVIDCEKPLSPSSRHALAGVDRVELGRGERAALRPPDRPGTLTIALADPLVSGAHAYIERDLDRYWLEDSGSRNGTRVNGATVRRRLLEDGDLIEVGRTLLLFRSNVRVPEATSLDWIPAASDTVLPGVLTLEPRLAAELVKLSRIARSDLSLLVMGESGTGKELLARAIHAASERSGAFVAVNCGAIPENLVESELFGWKRGAFSGAVSDHTGLVKSADRGTLFLDEIADLPLPSQAALLRVLQEREVRPVGGGASSRVDLRVIAATHQPLLRLVENGRFREDLYARILGFSLELPPLRKRTEDLGLLIGTLLERHAEDARRVRFEPGAALALLRHAWPRNIRELENSLKAALVLAEDGLLRREHFVLSPSRPPAALASEPEAEAPLAPSRPLDDAQKAHRSELVALFREHRGNVSAVARATGKARNQIQRWMKRYAINPLDFE